MELDEVQYMHLSNLTITLVLIATAASAQEPLRLKTRLLIPDASAPQMEVAAPTGRVHRVVQFASAPTAEMMDALTARGITIVGAVPVNGLLVTLDSDSISAAAGPDAPADTSGVFATL